MNKVNKVLVGIIIVLIVVILFLASYIIYSISLDNDIITNEEEILNIEDAKIIVRELDEKYFDYYSWLGPYCGEWDKDDYIYFGSYETNDFRDYYASNKFNSVNELRKYLESLLDSKIIPKYIDDDISYVEKDGKLYCQIPHKGGGFLRDYDVDAVYNISSIKADNIISNVTFWGYDMSVDLSSLSATINVVMNDEGKWVVSDYEINW